MLNKISSSDKLESLSDCSDISDGSNISEKSDKKTYSVYNANNTLISRRDIEIILSKYGIHESINSLEIWQRSFVHKSYSKTGKKKKSDMYELSYNSDSETEIDMTNIVPLQDQSNETLEWLGDGIIQGVVAMYLWSRYPCQDEGFLTKTRSKLVKTESLSKLSQFIGLEKHILMSHHVEIICNGRKNLRILEDTFEAFVGAMMIDFSGDDDSTAYGICSRFIIKVIEEAIDITELILKDDNYKDQLMRYFQKTFNGKFPKYYQDTVLNVINDNGTTTKRFQMYVMDINGNKIGTGTARSKKEAEQRAAKDALNHYGLINGF